MRLRDMALGASIGILLLMYFKQKKLEPLVDGLIKQTIPEHGNSCDNVAALACYQLRFEKPKLEKCLIRFFDACQKIRNEEQLNITNRPAEHLPKPPGC